MLVAALVAAEPETPLALAAEVVPLVLAELLLLLLLLQAALISVSPAEAAPNERRVRREDRMERRDSRLSPPFTVYFSLFVLTLSVDC